MIHRTGRLFVAATTMLLVAFCLTAEAQAAEYYHAPAGGWASQYTLWGTPRSLYGTGYGTGHYGYGTSYNYAPGYGYGANYNYGASYGSAPRSMGLFPRRNRTQWYNYNDLTGYGAQPATATQYGYSSNPRGRLTYDIQTPNGTVEHHYRYFRDGRVRLRVDD